MRYVGTYEGPNGAPVTSNITLDEGRLFYVPPAGGRMALIAESETTFSTTGAPVVFEKDSSGAVISFTVHTSRPI